MRMKFLVATAAALAYANTASAEVPLVAVDILPVHSLVAKVMEGLGSPDLIVQPGASPHGYSLRPSEAEALQRADIVFWVSESLSPWLEAPIASLAADAKSVELLEVEGTTELPFREGATFEKHSHEHEEHADEDHDHEEDHDHHGHDPHAWLDPENARVWLDAIAADLSALDPEHADAYAANAAAGKADLAALINEISAKLESFRGTHFIVFHDAYQYFENRFDFSASGSIRLADATDPSPARIAEIRDKVAELKVACVFTEPQFNPGLVKTVFQDTDAKVGVLDPLGANLTAGPDLYPQLLRNLTDSLVSCL